VGFFVKATNFGLNAILGKPSMVKKVYFPREILVISGCITAILQSFFESIVFIIFMIVLWIPLSWSILYLPYILMTFFILTMGTALAVAALNVFLSGCHIYLGSYPPSRLFHYPYNLSPGYFSPGLTGYTTP